MNKDRTIIRGILPEFKYRPCCLLTDKIFVSDIPVLGHIFPKIMVNFDIDKLNHKLGANWWDFILRREFNGTVYTCKAGFIDIGHLRDFADLTLYYYYTLRTLPVKNGMIEKGTKFPIYPTHGKISGEGVIQKNIPAGTIDEVDILISLARRIAYDVSIIYEIKTYGSTSVGDRHSSFSPEDLVSNFLGTYVAENAIREIIQLATKGDLSQSDSNKNFDVAIANELKNLLFKLGALTGEQTIANFNKISDRWVKSKSIVPDVFNSDYLRRRNFNIEPIVIWPVPGIFPECIDTEFPQDIELKLPDEIRSLYEAQYKFDSSFFLRSIFFSNQFSVYINIIKSDAINQFGDDFDKI